jgi:hypothetical protein
VSREIDLAQGILDHQLLDSEGRRCGKVDDLELEGIASGRPRAGAILVGAPAWRGRGPLGWLASRVWRGRLVRVPWTEVSDVGAGVALKRTAAELRLARGEARAGRIVERLPGSSL